MKTLFIAALLLGSTTLFAQAPAKTKEDSCFINDKIFTIVEEMPQFPGGEKEFFKFLTSNIKYPLDMERKKAGKAVYVTFQVCKNGSIQGVKILRGLDEAIDSDVMNAMQKMPQWVPGKQNDKAVAVQYNVAIKFAE
jgi:protein TonB